MRTEYLKYINYKDSSIKWIGLIPSEWHTRPIKFCVSTKVTDGPHETPTLVNDGVPFISAEAIKNNKIDFEKRRGDINKETDLIFSKKCKPKRDDVFLIKSGNTTGNAAIVETDIDFNIWSPLALMRANKEIMVPKFLLYSIRSISFQDSVKLFCSIGTQPNIGMNIIENLKVCIPSIPEQTQIANFLDQKTAQIDNLISQKEKLLKLLAEKRTAIITQAVTKGLDPNVEMKDSGIDWLGRIPKHWEVWKATHGFDKIGSGTTPKSDNPEYYNGDIPWVTTSELREGIISDTKQKITDLALVKNSLKFYTPGAIIIAMYGATIGRLGILEINATVNQACCVFDKPTQFASLFLYYWLWMSRDTLISLSNGGGQPNLSQDDLKQLRIPRPNVEEQIKIAEYTERNVSNILRMEQKIVLSVKQLKEYREALITAAVTGQIDVRKEAVNE